jgi:PEP-CTERM motif-containing protein
MMMTSLKIIACIAMSLAWPGFGNLLHAATMQSFGSGSAVTTADRADSFDSLNFANSGFPLDNYSSNGLDVRTNGNVFYGDDTYGFITTANQYFNPFHLSESPGSPHYPSYYNVGGGFYFSYDGDFGNTDAVTIEATDHKPIYGIEFLYGNGWTTGDIFGTYPWGSNTAVVEWQTRSSGSLVSSGFVTTGVGTVLGFYDPDGFDQLIVKAPHPNSSDPTLQELALDNLVVQLSPASVPVSIPEPPALALLVLGLIGLGFSRRK